MGMRTQFPPPWGTHSLVRENGRETHDPKSGLRLPLVPLLKRRGRPEGQRPEGGARLGTEGRVCGRGEGPQPHGRGPTVSRCVQGMDGRRWSRCSACREGRPGLWVCQPTGLANFREAGLSAPERTWDEGTSRWEGVWTLPPDPRGLCSVQLAARPAGASPSLWPGETERPAEQAQRRRKGPGADALQGAGVSALAPGRLLSPVPQFRVAGFSPHGPSALWPVSCHSAASCGCTTLGGLSTTLALHPDPKVRLHLEAGP